MILYVGPVTSTSGYGAAARHQVWALHRAGIPVRVFAPQPQVKATGRLVDLCEGLSVEWDKIPTLPFTKTVFHVTPDNYATFMTRYGFPAPRPHIGVVVWETTRLPEEWVEIMNEGFDQLWVPSHWMMRVYRDSGITVPMRHVPFGLDPEFFVPQATPNVDHLWRAAGIQPDTTVVYSCFQWTERKNPIGTLAAYSHAFTAKDNVVLVLRAHGRQFGSAEVSGAFHRAWADFRHPNPPRVMLIEDVLSDAELTDLHSRSSVYLGLSRGEGWGLPAHEAAIQGKPLILSDFSTPVETYGVAAWRVPVMMEPVREMAGLRWYAHPQLWAHPSTQVAARWLRFAHEDAEERLRVGAACKAATIRYSASAVAPELLHACKESP